MALSAAVVRQAMPLCQPMQDSALPGCERCRQCYLHHATAQLPMHATGLDAEMLGSTCVIASCLTGADPTGSSSFSAPAMPACAAVWPGRFLEAAAACGTQIMPSYVVQQVTSSAQSR